MNPSEDQILELEKMILKQFNWNEEELIHVYREMLKRMGQGKKRRKSKYHAYYEAFCELARREEGVGKNQLIGIEGNPWTRKHGNATQAVKESIEYCEAWFGVEIEKVGSKWQLKVDTQSLFNRIFESVKKHEGDFDVSRLAKGQNQATVRKELEKRGAVNAGGMKFRVDNHD